MRIFPKGDTKSWFLLDVCIYKMASSKVQMHFLHETWQNSLYIEQNLLRYKTSVKYRLYSFDALAKTALWAETSDF